MNENYYTHIVEDISFDIVGTVSNQKIHIPNEIKIKLIIQVNGTDISQVNVNGLPSNWSILAESDDKQIVLISDNNSLNESFLISYQGDYNGTTTYNKIILTIIPSIKTEKTLSCDLSSPLRKIDNYTEPLCLGIETDDSSLNYKFEFKNAEIVKGCRCTVQLEAANGQQSIQEITNKNSQNFSQENTIKTINDDGTIFVNWKPNSFITKQDGLVKFAFQFSKINDDNEYELVLNTSPIQGYVHNGLNVTQTITSEVYPSELAELYDKYNKLVNDGDQDILELESIYDIREYLNARVPEALVEDNSNKTGYIVGYDPSTYKYYYTSNIHLDKDVIHGAIWNDYAEYREGTDIFEAGRTVKENGNDTLSLCTERLEPGASIVSDTFGFIIGKSDINGVPIAVSGRALAYPYENRDSYKPGDAVCSGPNGTVSKMTREEIKEYPERIIGTVSAVPDYEEWGTGHVKINGRIWIKIK